MAKATARPCTLALTKDNANGIQKKIFRTNATILEKKKAAIYNKSSAHSMFNKEKEKSTTKVNSSISVTSNTEMDYYQLVYLTKSDKNYGACGSNKSEIDTPLFESRDVGSFPKGCLKDSFQFCVLRNLMALGIAVMFINTGYLSIKTMQSSVHAESGYGVVSLSCIYASTIVSCVLTCACLKSFSQRATITVTALTAVVYFLCNSVPPSHLYLLIPGSCVFGMSQGLMWISLSAYITRLAYTYATKTETDKYSVLCKFNGVVYGIISSSYIFAYFLSSTHFWLITKPNFSKAEIMKTDSAVESDEVDFMTTNLREGQHSITCGTNYANERLNYNSYNNTLGEIQVRSVQYSVWLIYCLLCILLSFLAIVTVVVLLRKLPHVDVTEHIQVPLKGSYIPFRGLWQVAKELRLQLLIPIILFTALKQGFVLADYTKAYISCALQVEKIGLIMLSYGTVCTLGSIFAAVALQHLKRYLMALAAALFEVGNLIVLYMWTPHVGDEELFYVVAACMGMCDAIWQTLISVLLGDMFHDMPVSAFAMHRILYSSGLCAAFAYSHYLSITVKLTILVVFLALGLCFYGVKEIRTKLCTKTFHSSSGSTSTNFFIMPKQL